MLALSPWVASLRLFLLYSPQFPKPLPTSPHTPANPPPSHLQCQELSDKQVSVASLRDVKELGDNNCEICGKCGHLHGLCIGV